MKKFLLLLIFISFMGITISNQDSLKAIHQILDDAQSEWQKTFPEWKFMKSERLVTLLETLDLQRLTNEEKDLLARKIISLQFTPRGNRADKFWHALIKDLGGEHYTAQITQNYDKARLALESAASTNKDLAWKYLQTAQTYFTSIMPELSLYKLSYMNQPSFKQKFPPELHGYFNGLIMILRGKGLLMNDIDDLELIPTTQPISYISQPTAQPTQTPPQSAPSNLILEKNLIMFNSQLQNLVKAYISI